MASSRDAAVLECRNRTALRSHPGHLQDGLERGGLYEAATCPVPGDADLDAHPTCDVDCRVDPPTPARATLIEPVIWPIDDSGTGE
jgi:hypothetical protein